MFYDFFGHIFLLILILGFVQTKHMKEEAAAMMKKIELIEDSKRLEDGYYQTNFS